MRQSEYMKLAEGIISVSSTDNKMDLCGVCADSQCTHNFKREKCIKGISKGLKQLMEGEK